MATTDAPGESRRPASRADVRRLVGLRRQLTTRPDAVVGPATTRDGLVSAQVTLSVPGSEPVPCVYLRPVGAGPWPGAVAVHQHNGEFSLGKSEPAGLAGDPSMAYGAATARRGIACLLPDLSGFETRSAAGTDRRTEEQEASRLVEIGTSLQARHVEDVALCLTWLSSRAEVVGRLGVIGHSLGGQVAFFTAACDDRVAAAVISCGLGTIASFDRESIAHNPAWYVPGIREAGDTPALAAVVTGTRLWVSAGAADPLFPLDGVEAVVAAFPAGSAELHVFDGRHGFPSALADEATAWLARSLGVLPSTGAAP